MTIENQIRREYFLLLGFLALSVISLTVGYVATASLHRCWFANSGAVGGIFAGFAISRHKAALRLINPNSAFGTYEGNQRRQKYLPRFLKPLPKHGPNFLALIGTLVWAFGNTFCSV